MLEDPPHHLSPPNQQQPPLSTSSSPPHVTPVFWGRNHRLPSCSISLFFQTPIHVHLPFHFSMFRITEALRATLSNQCFSFKKMLSSLISRIYTNLPSPLCLPPPITDSLWFAAGSQSAVVRHPLLEQLEPRRPAQPRPAAGPQLPIPGKKHIQVETHSIEEERGPKIAVMRTQRIIVYWWCLVPRRKLWSSTGEIYSAAKSPVLTSCCSKDGKD